MKPNLKQYSHRPSDEKRGSGVQGACGPPPPPLFQKSNFAANVFLQIRFCVILQGI